MIRRSRVVIVICPVARGDGARDRSAARRIVLIENAPGSAEERRDAGAGGGACGERSGSRPRRRSCSTPARSRPIRGSICCSRRWRIVQRAAARRAAGAGGRQARPGRARARAGARRRHRRRDDLRRRAAGGGDSRVSARGRRAGVAAVARHEHAAEDLPVPALGQADRRHAAADAHAGAERRHRDPHRRVAAASSPTAFSRRSTIRRAPRRSGAAARELAETKYSYEAYLERTRRACARAGDRGAAPLARP